MSEIDQMKSYSQWILGSLKEGKPHSTIDPRMEFDLSIAMIDSTSGDILGMATGNQDLLVLPRLDELPDLHARVGQVPAKLVEPALNLDCVADLGTGHIGNVDVCRDTRFLAAALCNDGHAGSEVDYCGRGGAMNATERVHMLVLKDQVANDAAI